MAVVRAWDRSNHLFGLKHQRVLAVATSTGGKELHTVEMWKLTVLFIVFPAFTGVQCKESQNSKNMDPVDPGAWDLPSGNVYDQMFDITPENHDDKIMKSEDAWIVVFYKGKVHKKWRDLVSVIGGSVWFGTVNVEKYPSLAERVKLDLEHFNVKSGLAVIYPMHRHKKRDAIAAGELKSTPDSRQAELLASATIPDRSTDFTFAVEELQKFNDWVVKGYYYEQPPKFPVICMTDDTETPIHVKVLSHYMHTHFNFGIVRKKSIPAMRKLFKQVPEPQKYPVFLVLLGMEPSSEEMDHGNFNMRFNIMPFIEPKYGDSRHIRSLINFLFVANDDFRKEIPGRMPHEPAQISKMDTIRGTLSQRVAIAASAPKNNKKRKTEL